MKNLGRPIMVLILIAAGALAYKWFAAAPSEACLAYQKFADRLARGDLKQAADMATGDAVDAVNNATPISPVGPPVTQGVLTEQSAGKVDNVWYKIESEEAAEGGKKVMIGATQYVHRYRAGDRAVGGGVTNKFKHYVELQRDESGWKVSTFKQEHIGNE